MATKLTDYKQIHKRTTTKNQNRSAALGRPAMKLLGAGKLWQGGGSSTSLRSTIPSPKGFKPGDKVLALFPIAGRPLEARYVGLILQRRGPVT